MCVCMLCYMCHDVFVYVHVYLRSQCVPYVMFMYTFTTQCVSCHACGLIVSICSPIIRFLNAYWQVAAAVAGVSSIASRIISEPTRRSYTQVCLSLCIHSLRQFTVFLLNFLGRFTTRLVNTLIHLTHQ